jgi:hypothetical protein
VTSCMVKSRYIPTTQKAGSGDSWLRLPCLPLTAKRTSGLDGRIRLRRVASRHGRSGEHSNTRGPLTDQLADSLGRPAYEWV